MTRPDHERGVALLTVLLLVAVMAVLAVALLDDVRFGLRRTANAETVGQAQWYAVGAEALARARIAELNDESRVVDTTEWAGRTRAFPTEAGAVRVTLNDAGDCFNLNSFVRGAAGVYEVSEAAERQFVALGAALGLGPAEALGIARQARARLAQGLFVDASELRELDGVTEDAWTRLRPHVCALPVAGPAPVNVNTLTPDDWPLLVALSEGRIGADLARRALAERPRGGFPDATAFWNRPVLAAAFPSDEALEQTTVRTRFFRLDVEVDHLDAEVSMTALLDHAGGRDVRLAARRWNPA